MSGGGGNQPNYAQPTAQAIQWARSAGFSGIGLVIIVAIARAESGLNATAQNVNSDAYHSVDRGILQINNHWHPEVSDTCAYNPPCAFQQAFRISNGGTSFTPWATFNSGAYAAYASFTANLAGVQIPNSLKQQEIKAQNSNVPVIGGVENALGGCAPWDIGCIWSNLQVSLSSIGQHIAVFVVAALIFIVGFMLIFENTTNNLIQRVKR